MTPLLPHPIPWPAGESLRWARDRGWEEVTRIGSVAIQPVPHRVDEETLPPGLERWLPRERLADLVVRCQGSSRRPTWHSGNGLYGFVGLPPGPQTLTVEDPLGRTLPARLSVVVPAQRVYRLALRPGPGAARKPGSTGIWGQILDRLGRPIPYALIQLQTRFSPRQQPATVTTWSDGSGGYAVNLDGESTRSPGTDVVERQGSICLPMESFLAALRSGLAALPEIDRALLEAWQDGVGPVGYGPPRASGTHFRFRDGPEPNGTLSAQALVTIGRQRRWDIVWP
ncbi:MAG: hypothetical protein ACK55X_11030 [Synechococcaceae cyanobacterium]|jgi:hypothetical protein